jgi:hypothetical protein
MANLRLPRGPDELLGYFAGVNRDYPAKQWEAGVELCHWWLRLLAEGATQPEIDRFVARLESEPCTGSGWLDLGMQFRHWARSSGFNVRELPHCLDKGKD